MIVDMHYHFAAVVGEKKDTQTAILEFKVNMVDCCCFSFLSVLTHRHLETCWQSDRSTRVREELFSSPVFSDNLRNKEKKKREEESKQA